MPADPDRPEADYYGRFLTGLAGLIDDAEMSGFDRDGIAHLREANEYFRSDYRILHPESENAGRYAGLRLVIEAARRLVCRPGNDFSWSGWDGEDDAAREIDGIIFQLKSGQLPDPAQMRVLFAPTGPLQELSMSSGWGEEFLLLAESFDREFEQVQGVK